MAAPTEAARPIPAPGGPPPGRPRSTHPWLIRLLKGAIIFVALCLLASAGGYLYIRHQIGRIKHVDIPTLTPDQPGTTMNVLLVGSDSRANTTGDLADATGKTAEGDRTGLSDTMMILHIDPKQTQAAVLSIPRDLCSLVIEPASILCFSVNSSPDSISAHPIASSQRVEPPPSPNPDATMPIKRCSRKSRWSSSGGCPECCWSSVTARPLLCDPLILA